MIAGIPASIMRRKVRWPSCFITQCLNKLILVNVRNFSAMNPGRFGEHDKSHLRYCKSTLYVASEKNWNTKEEKGKICVAKMHILGQSDIKQ